MEDKTKQKLEKLENERMVLEFKDNWARKDFKRAKELDNEIEELKKRS